MAMSLLDTLPLDAGTQKFLAPVNPSNGQFVLFRAVNVETFDSLTYGDLTVALRPSAGKTTQTHNAVSVDTTESVGTEVTSGGYSKVAVFLEVGAGADIRVRIYGRLTTSGNNYLIALVTDGQQAETRQCYLVEFAAPYLAVGLQAVAGSATCSCTVYLIP